MTPIKNLPRLSSLGSLKARLHDSTIFWRSLPNGKVRFTVLKTTWTHNSNSFILCIYFNGVPTSHLEPYFVSITECEPEATIAKYSPLLNVHFSNSVFCRYATELYWNACSTIVRLFFSHSTSHIIDFWSCRYPSCNRFLNSQGAKTIPYWSSLENTCRIPQSAVLPYVRNIRRKIGQHSSPLLFRVGHLWITPRFATGHVHQLISLEIR